MAVTATPVFVQTPKVTVTSVTSTDTADTTFATLCTAGANGTKVIGINITSDDGTASHVVRLYITRSAVAYAIGAMTVAISAGFVVATAGVDGLAAVAGLPVDNDGQAYLFLVSGDTLTAQFSTAMTASKKIYFNTIHGDF